MSIESEEDKSKAIQIFEKYHGLMFYVANGILKDYALAEDAVSDSYVKLILNLHKIEDVSCGKTRRLIVIIVRNTAINIYNKNFKTNFSQSIEDEQPVDESPAVPDEVISSESYDIIVNIINSLSDSIRDIAMLSFVYEWSHKEIEKLTGLRPGTIRMKLTRARNTIKNELIKQQMQIGR